MFYSQAKSSYKLPIKILSAILAMLMVFSTGIIACYAQAFGVPEKLETENILSDYMENIVDLDNVKSIDKEKTEGNELFLNMKDGSTTVYEFSEPVVYKDEKGDLKCKDNSIIEQTDDEKANQGYDYSNAQNDYRINFSSDSAKGVSVESADVSFSLSPVSSISAPGYISKGTICNEEFEDFEYADIYGSNTLLKYFPQLNGIKEEIVLDENIGKNTFSFTLKTDGSTPVVNNDGSIALINKNNEKVQSFDVPFAYDRAYVEGVFDCHYCADCEYKVEKVFENTYTLTVTVSEEWLNSDNTVYPVTIDPTAGNISNSMDVPIHSGVYNSGMSGNNNAVGTSNQYGTSRTLVYFSYPSEIKKYARINSAEYYTRELTGRTSNMGVEIYKVTSGWNNNSTWAQRPDWDPKRVDYQNINSKSTVNGSNYWYKFNITSIVQSHINGESNRGFMMKYDDEDASAKNLRTFAQLEYSTSSMRPYTVINYNNDTVKPTVEKVTKTPSSEWSNQDVSISISGAKDNYSGLAQYPYSFSTQQGVYDWHTMTHKTFTQSCKVWVYVQDKAGNINNCATIDVKIDKVAPTITNVKTTENSNNTVTVNVTATDSSSGVSAYSFSTQPGVYSWASDNQKTFSENGTIYIYAKDKAGNISEYKKVEIDVIDVTPPTVPVVSGNTDDWSNTDVVLTAQSTDDKSGVAAYSFSDEKGVYRWQTDNTKIFTESAVVYVYAMDNEGNISEPNTVYIKIDKSAPTGAAVSGNPTNWSKSATLTVSDSVDDVSGLNVAAYSFSTAENEYKWQEENSKTFSSNCTVYVYVRDAANNICLVDTVVIDKVDGAAPVINKVNCTENNGKTTLTVEASDALTGVSLYSFDGGNTWQESNTFTFDKDTRNFINISVKDFVGNIAKTKYSFYLPQFYEENNLIYLYNPNLNIKCDIYYKFSIFGQWQKYSEPFVIPQDHEYVYASFDNSSFLLIGSSSYRITKTEPKIGNYKESGVDFTFSYFDTQFDFSRYYDNDDWFYSIDSHIEFFKDKNQYTVILPDYHKYTFIPKDKYTYFNGAKGCTLSVKYNENGTEIIGYTVTVNNMHYGYDPDGRLISIENKYNHKISFARLNDNLTVSDSAGRRYNIKFDGNGNVSTVTDPAGGVITYTYQQGHLMSVTDQAGVILGKYEYNEKGLLSKSMDKSVFYDSENRVVRYLYDSGAYSDFEYNSRSVTVNTSAEQEIIVNYNDYGNITLVTQNGNETSYEYDENQRLVSVRSNGENIKSYSFDEYGNLIYSSEKGGESNSYTYDEQGNCIRKSTYSNNKYNYFYYVYDEAGNVVLSAAIKEDYKNPPPQEYDENLDCFDITEYTYDNGLLIKSDDKANNVQTFYTYDNYGNVIKTTSAVTENENTSINASESSYDILGRLLLSKSDDSEITYVYDAAGRTLLTNADGNYQRTVYDRFGRTVQEIGNSEYKPELDNLPKAYGDTSVGQRYIYDDAGNLVKEINSYDIETDYSYSDVGNLYKKSFDIYDYYYKIDGSCDKIVVNGKTIIDYDYKVEDSQINKKSDQNINRITYANGYVEEQKTDQNNNILEKYANGHSYYSIFSSYETSFTYSNDEIDNFNTITSADDSFSFIQRDYTFKEIFSYKTESADDSQTIVEEHFGGKEYQTVIKENSLEFNAPDSSFSYTVNGDENSASANILIDSSAVLSSNIAYDENENCLSKSYSSGNMLFAYKYDSNGNIIEADGNRYTYNELGELVSAQGTANSSYTYDSRGNMLSKTINGNETAFSYNNAEWQDQLTAVNGVELSYDANGNLTDYGNVHYSWSHGKWLDAVSDEENTYSYKYDSNGIRSSKTVGGVTTKYDVLGSRVLAQYDGTNNIYFQYGNETPIGFVLNDTQYFYITNLSGDVVGITDAQGNLIARYTYDEWGGLLEITPAEEDNAEQMRVAEINPLRYRGYYYDNETGMYYLQSRYYNPELCRFISADSFEYISNKNPLSINAYSYCSNNPVGYADYFGYSSTVAGGLLGGLGAGLGLAIGDILIIIIIICLVIGTCGIAALLFEDLFDTKTETRTLSDTSAKQRKSTSREYQLCYINGNGSLVKIGPKLTFTETLAAFGVANPKSGISNRYSVNTKKLSRTANSLYKDPNVYAWGVYADSQVAAKTLAVVLGSSAAPEVHGSGSYAHYHDGKHSIHIWYGNKIKY